MKFALALTTLALASPLIATPLAKPIIPIVPFIPVLVAHSSGKNTHIPNNLTFPLIDKRKGGGGGAAGGGGHGAVSSGGYSSSTDSTSTLLTSIPSYIQFC